MIKCDHYDYDDVDLDKITGSSGGRLVGARKGSHQVEAPFLVAMNTFGSDWSSCTGMLITPTYVLSAAHCTEYIRRFNRDKENNMCVEKTNAGKTYSTNGFTLQCRIITTKIKKKNIILQNLEIVPISPKGKVWMGVDDISKAEGESSEIKRVIRHAYSYKGGGDYGSFGGYDITIVELDKSLTKFQKACLPSLQFNDVAIGKLARTPY